MSTFIQLNINNYKSFAPITAAAFFVAEPGAQGHNGNVVILSTKGEIYSWNFIYGDLTAECISELCPPLFETKFRIGGQGDITPEGWNPLYLGFGNHLIVADGYAFLLIRELSASQIANRGEAYQNWLKIMVGIVSGKDSENYLNMKSFPEECSINYNHDAHGKRNPNVINNAEKMFQGPFSLEDLITSTN